MMKFKVILFCVLLFCSKIVDSIPHSENHVRQRVNPLSNGQVNKNVPNAQYLDTDFTQTRNVNKLINSAIQQENNEDYSNQRGYNYDSYGYNKVLASSPSAKEPVVHYDSLADGRRLDSYAPRVESYPSHTSQVEFDHQQYRNQKWRSQNPFTNSDPSSVLISNDERPVVTSVQEPYRSLAQYLKPKYVPSLNRRFYQGSREQIQYPSVDQAGDNKYVVNPATRLGSRGPYENYSEGQASNTKIRPTVIHRHVQNFETPSEIIYETPAVESPDTLADQPENVRYLVPYENYSEGQASHTKTRPTGVRRHVQNFETPSEIIYETPAVESIDTLVDQSKKIRYRVPYENYRESQASETKTRLTGVRRHVQNLETPSEINYEIPAVESPDTLVDQSENVRYPVPYENFSEGQASDTKTRPTGVRRHVQNFETPSEIIYKTPAVESPDTLADQSENIRHPAPYENFSEGQASETKRRPIGVRRHVQNFETPSEIIYETPAVETSDTLVDQSEKIRYHVPYENYREGQASETKTRLIGVRRDVQNFETPSEINYEIPTVESQDTLVDQSENIRYPLLYENYSGGQASDTKTRLTDLPRHVQNFETPSEINYEIPAVESPDTLVDQSENIRYSVPYENNSAGQAFATKRRLTGVRRHVHNFETPSGIIDETPAVDSSDTLAHQSENIKYVENSRSRSHLSNTAPIISHDDSTPVISETDNYSSDSRPSNKEATVEISKIFDDKPIARIYAHGSDSGWSNIAHDNSNNDAHTDLTETVEVKEGKYGTNFAEKKPNSINTYPEDSPTSTNTVLENSGSYKYEESNVPRYESGSPNNSKENLIHQLTSGIKEMSLKSLVANPDIQYILTRTDKRYVVVHSNGTIEYLDTLPLDSEQDSKLRLVHTKRKNIDGTQGDGVLTPQWPQNLTSNIAKPPAPVDEYLWPTNNQPADEYDSNRFIPFKDLLAGHSHLKPLFSHAEQPRDNDNSKPPPVNQSADGGYSKPLIPNEDQLVDDSNSNQHKDDDNSKSLTPNEAQLAYEANPKLNPENQSEDDDNSNPLRHDENHPTDDNILKYSTSPETQPRDDDSSKSLHTHENKSRDKINLTPYARNPVHDKIHKHGYVTHPANDNTPLLPNEAQPSDDTNSEPLPAHRTQPAHDTKLKHSHGNQPENDDNSSPSSPNKNQPADDNNSEPLNENLSGDAIVPNLFNPYYRHHKKSKHSHGNQPENDDNSSPTSPNKNQSADEYDSNRLILFKDSHLKPLFPHAEQPTDNENSKPLPPPVNQSADGGYSKPLIPNEDQLVDDSNSNQHKDDDNSKSLTPNEAQLAYEANPKLNPENQSEDDDNSNPLRHDENHPTDDNILKHSTSPETQPRDDDSSKSLHTHENKSKDKINLTPYARNPVHDKRHKHGYVTHPANDNTFKPLLPNEAQPSDDTNSEPLPAHGTQPAHDTKLKHSHGNQPENDDNSSPSSPNKNQPADDNNSEPLNENLSGDAIVPNLFNPYYRHHKKSKHSHGNKPADHNNSNPSSTPEPLDYPKNQPADDTTAKPLLSNGNQSGDSKNSKPIHTNENQTGDDNDSEPFHHSTTRNKSKHFYGNQHEDDDNSNSASENQPAEDKTSKPLHSHEDDTSPVKQPENNKTANNQSLNENQSEDDIDSKSLPPHKKQRVHHNKPKHWHVNQESNNDNSNSSFQDENQPGDDNAAEPLASNEDQSEVEIDSTPLPPHKKQRAHHNKSGAEHTHVNQPADDNNSNPVSLDENHQTNDNISKLLPSNKNDKQPMDDKSEKPQTLNENQSEGDFDFKPLSPHKKPRAHHNKSKPNYSHVNLESDDDNSKPSSQDENKSVDDNNSKTSPDETQPEDDKKSKSMPTSENNPTDDFNSKPTPAVSNKNDDKSKSTTLSLTVPNYTTTLKPQAIKKHKRKHSHRKTTTKIPVVSTTPSPDDSSEDQIITLSPIEQLTDNVSDVPTLTTTTAKPVETPDKQDTYKDANHKPDETKDNTKSSSEDLASISAKVQTSTTAATPSSSSSPTDNASYDKVKGKSEENENKAIVSKENNEKDNTQTAVYNSSELLDTNIDVPEETDDYSSVTSSSSVQNDVNTGDNSSELEQSETDVTITVSSSTTNDSEDDIITINIEVSESTDDADSPSNDQTLVVSIDTNPDNDDDSKTLQTDVSKTTKTEDCNVDPNHDDGRGKNVEIDLSNMKGEPTMWIKTTNQDFIDNLTAKNDTQFDVIYFFNIENQPTIETEREITIFCNGTVVIKTTEITYAHEDDPTPTIVKTTEIMEIEDYELNK